MAPVAAVPEAFRRRPERLKRLVSPKRCNVVDCSNTLPRFPALLSNHAAGLPVLNRKSGVITPECAQARLGTAR